MFECREYQNYLEQRTAERASFRRRHPRRAGRRPTPFPPELSEPQSFATWLEADVDEKLANNVADIHLNVTHLYQLPSQEATKYRSMWAFGNHIRVASAERQLVTSDSGIAATFRRPCRSGLRDCNPVMANIEYVGTVEEILEINYRGLCVTVLVCD